MGFVVLKFLPTAHLHLRRDLPRDEKEHLPSSISDNSFVDFMIDTKNNFTLYTGCLKGILKMLDYNPHVIVLYNPFFNHQQLVVFSLLIYIFSISS